MTQILLIEDDPEITELLSRFLSQYNLEINGVETPSSALNSLKIDHYDLIILDLSLPEMDGMELCKLIRKEYDTPIIISSARSDLGDKVMGLELGADDYLPKPYEPRELVARIQTVLRRYKKIESTDQGSFIINEEKMQITHDETVLDLTLAEYEILRLFILKKGMVISRDYIANNVEAIGWESSDRSIDVIISRIRHKLAHDDTQAYIKTVRGAGYKFIGA
ncbi:MAG: response regulator transcription factor [Epsilonproteobacteria bacterium]|nr:response regulator transcription factor [Campylobacterota bacterium]